MTDHAQALAEALRKISRERYVTAKGKFPTSAAEIAISALAAYDADKARKGGDEGQESWAEYQNRLADIDAILDDKGASV